MLGRIPAGQATLKMSEVCEFASGLAGVKGAAMSPLQKSLAQEFILLFLYGQIHFKHSGGIHMRVYGTQQAGIPVGKQAQQRVLQAFQKPQVQAAVQQSKKKILVKVAALITAGVMAFRSGSLQKVAQNPSVKKFIGKAQQYLSKFKGYDKFKAGIKDFLAKYTKQQGPEQLDLFKKAAQQAS